MRFLKNKIQHAKAFSASQAKKAKDEMKTQPPQIEQQPLSKPKRASKSKQQVSSSDCEDGKATKNIPQNFGRAICNFALSDIGLPYVTPILEKEKLALAVFRSFMEDTKKSMRGVIHFREALLINKLDSEEAQALKRAFRDIGEIFIKYFSVNWIFNGKVNYKKACLKFRFKILRRIQNPELFTYIR